MCQRLNVPTDPKEADVLAAMKTCFERWGIAKTTLDDIAEESGISRATIYRMYPGGRRALVEAYRAQQRVDAGIKLHRAVTRYRSESNPPTLPGLLARIVSVAARNLMARESLGEMVVFAPEIAAHAAKGVPSAIEAATDNLSPFLYDFVPEAEARRLVNVALRLMFSYHMAPSDDVDLSNEAHALELIAPLVPESSRLVEISSKD